MKQKNTSTNKLRDIQRLQKPGKAITIPVDAITREKLEQETTTATTATDIKIYGRKDDAHKSFDELKGIIADSWKISNIDPQFELSKEQIQWIEQTARQHKLFLEIDEKNSLQFGGTKDQIEKINTLVENYLLRNKPKEGDVVYPQDWIPQGNTNLKIIELSPDCKEFKDLTDRFNQTLSSKKILKIERIQNKWLWEKYFFQKLLLEKKNKHKNNEYLLFHGTRNNSPQALYNGQDGFDYKFSDGGMWGRGTYFATNAIYSDDYSYTIAGGKEKQLFMAFVLVGDTIEIPSDRNIKMPPPKPRTTATSDYFVEERYDSVKAQTSTSINYVVYDISRAYPAYIITYN